MSRFIDRLKKLSRAEFQPIGFGTKQPVSPKLRIQLIASLAQENAEDLADHVAGADAGLLRISNLSSGGKTLQKISQAMPDIPWGGWLPDSSPREIKQLTKTGCDFVVFPTNTPLAILENLENDEVGKILEVDASLTKGLLRATNALPIDAVLIASQQRDDYLLTWQHLMLFQRFADLLTKPLLVLIPSKVTSDELQALWQTGVEGVVTEVRVGQPQDRLKELRRVIDELAFPSLGKDKRVAPLLPPISQETSMTTTEEEEEEEE